jgi:hypothetical protein
MKTKYNGVRGVHIVLAALEAAEREKDPGKTKERADTATGST